MQLYDYKIQALKYCLPYLRQNRDIKTVLTTIGDRYNKLQAVFLYLLDTLKINNARGVWLDNIGKEVGAVRSDTDYGDYFCVNAEHINVPKLFYNSTSAISPENTISLADEDFITKIQAYILANISCGTRNQNIRVIKMITRADEVIITKTDTCTLSVNLIGDASKIILTQNTVNFIRHILADGIYIEEITING
jgi:hypothetical protein